MKIILIRHGIAFDKRQWAEAGHRDEERPLTSDGKRRMRQVARGLRRAFLAPSVLAYSPLKRTQQTATIVSVAWKIDAVELPQLAPDGSQQNLVHWLNQHDPGQTLALVGHEPYLSLLACRWLGATPREGALLFKKGSVAMFDFASKAAAGKGSLSLMLSPAVLKRL